MAEFLTATRYALPIKVFVVNNAPLGRILWQQMVLGFLEYGVRWEHPANFAPLAEACAGVSRRIERRTGPPPAARPPGPGLELRRADPSVPGLLTREDGRPTMDRWHPRLARLGGCAHQMQVPHFWPQASEL
jgi:pyruvate dehydrogenase (quinone)